MLIKVAGMSGQRQRPGNFILHRWYFANGDSARGEDYNGGFFFQKEWLRHKGELYAQLTEEWDEGKEGS